MRTPAAPDKAVAALDKGELWPLVARFILGLIIACSLAALLGYLARRPAEALALEFVRRFGVWGMALGTLLADSFHFPVPPQFYMLLAIASKTSIARAFPAIAFASWLSGWIGYQVASWASRLRWLAEKTEPYRHALAQAFERQGYRVALVASLLPIPYSMLCYLAGLNRMPVRFLALLGLYRIPKLLGFYGLVYFGWSLS